MSGYADSILDLDRQFCFALYSASRRVTRGYSLALKPLGLTYPQYLVLLVLWEWDRNKCKEPTVTALGERLELDSGTLTPLIRRLVAQGLVVKSRHSRDERQVFVTLTHAGKALRRRAKNIPLGLLKQSSMPLAELEQLREQLKRV